MTDTNYSTDSPVIIVTGASSGIGAATARRFAREGYRVVLAARRDERLKTLEEEIISHGGIALPVVTDMTKLDEIQNLVQQTIETFGQINLLFNNAGFGRMGWLEELDPVEDIEAQLHTNLLGMIQMTQSVLPYMIEHQEGHIINMASMAGLVGTPTYTIYAASKFGVRGFSEALRREVGVYGISVSVIYPGGAATEFSKKARIHRRTGTTTPPWLRLNAEDVAEAVLSLARRPRRSLITPWSMRIIVWANAWFPGLLDWAVEKWFVVKEKGMRG
ncbi:MAG: SDR family oxidoreductase [Chloroflexota bacterium]|nr:SDR family oxidoreductase [Chloroflexota bacterium]